MSGAVAVGQVWQDVHNGRNVRIAAVEGDEVAYTGGESSILSSYVWYFMLHHRLVTADVPMPEVEQGETKGEVEHGVCAVTSWETRSAQLQFAMKTHAETVREHELARIALEAAEMAADLAWKNERAASSAVNALVDTMRQECAEEVL